MVSDGRRTPHPRRARLARHLRLLREDAELTIKSVGRRMGWSGSKVSRIETGLSGITPGDAARLLDIYNVTGPRRDWMLGLASSGNPRHVPGAFRELEAESAAVLGYESILVPGILQVPEYTRAIIQSHRPEISVEETERLIELRVARQALLTRADGPQFHLVVDEIALRRPVGGEPVIRAQIRRLMELGELDSVMLQVLPLECVAHPAPNGAFTVLQFRDDLDPGIVALSHHLGTIYFDAPTDVEGYVDLFRRLSRHALDPGDSAKLVTRLASG
ncbi:helix-turn-helix domain-containing protein [Longispora urticae]